MKKITIEIRIKNEPSWEDTDVYATVTIDWISKKSEIPQAIANFTGMPVRWNIQGLEQGHYVEPQSDEVRAALVLTVQGVGK